MCGIFGMVQTNPMKAKENRGQILQDLLEHSQTRGQDSTGVATWSDNGIQVLKRPVSALKLSKLPEFKGFVKENIQPNQAQSYFLMLGNCRLATAGDSYLYENSQPIIDQGMVMAHNGLVVNADQIYKENTELKRNFNVDTEVLPDLISYYLKQGLSLEDSTRKTFAQIKGSASIAFFPPGPPTLVLATNNSSLFYRLSQSDEGISLVFASESFALDQLRLNNTWGPSQQLQPMEALTLQGEKPRRVKPFSLISEGKVSSSLKESLPLTPLKIKEIKKGLKSLRLTTPRDADEKLLKFDEASLRKQKRCTRCILPEGFPFIEFDKDGLCSTCRSYRSPALMGKEALVESLHTSSGKPAKIIVALSGGRDSCYALHYLRKELNLPVIAYTYDWGVVTSLARRNMSLMCSELGVEHILVSANIAKKRENIRKNILAWLKRPRLGTVPLFMAGDKQFFYYAQVVKKQNNADHLIFGMNPLEKTDFKVGFCGIKNDNDNRHYHLNLFNQAKMISWYGYEFLRNPSYINSSLLDTAFGYYSYYLSDHTYKILYQYIPWFEKEVEETLVSGYGWETAEDTSSTWRIGDGTASFYNYIYYTGAGFTESDTFRSNQIREGHITREQALDMAVVENRPRFQSIKWYCETMNLDFNSTISQINQLAGKDR